MDFITRYALRLSIGLAGAAFAVWLEGTDRDQIVRAEKLLQASADAFKAAERRRVIGTTVNTELSLNSPLEIIREKKSAFDAAFAEHQERVNQVFPAASFGLVRYSDEFKKFQLLYEDRLAVCMLKPMRVNLEARYRCTVAGGQNCVRAIELDKDKCGTDYASFKTLSEKALVCITELRAALDRSVETKVRYLGLTGRLSFIWRKLTGADTDLTVDGRSWKEALIAADQRECQL